MNGYEYIDKQKDILFEEKIDRISKLRRVNKYLDIIDNIKDEESDNYDKFIVEFKEQKLILYGVKDVSVNKSGYGGNLKYYKTDFISKNKNNDQMKLIIADKIYDLLCIKENCFDLILEEKYYRIYKQKNKIMGIYTFFLDDYIDEFKKVIRNIEAEEKIIYSFSFTDYINEELFNDMKVKVKPIPTRILEMLNNLSK